MANFRLMDRDTSYLLPPSVDEWLPDDHLVRFVIEITDQLDISVIERKHNPRLEPQRVKIYGRRKATVETVFGIIKKVIGFRQFLLRGLHKTTREWSLVQSTYNLKRMHALAG